MHLFCPNCGREMAYDPSGGVNRCPDCGNVQMGGGPQPPAGPQEQMYYAPPPQGGYGPGQYPPPGPGYGRYEQEIGIGDALNTGFEVYKGNFMEFFKFWAIPAVLAIALSIMTLVFSPSTAAFENVDPEQADAIMGSLFEYLGFTLGFAFLSTLIELLFTGGLIGMTKEAMLTGKTVASTGFDTIKKHFGGILVVGIVFPILVFVGICLCCVPGILFCYWWMFAMTAVVVEGASIGQAFSNSKDYATRHRTLGFAIVLVIVLFIVNLIGSIPAAFVSFSGGQYIGSVFSGIVSWVIAPYAAITIAVHYIRGKGYDSGVGPMQWQPPQAPPATPYQPQPTPPSQPPPMTPYQPPPPSYP